MELKELSWMLKSAIVEGTEKVIGNTVLRPVLLSKSAAYRIYGRSNVDRWLSEGLIKVSSKRFDRLQLEAVAASCNRNTYLPVAERY